MSNDNEMRYVTTLLEDGTPVVASYLPHEVADNTIAFDNFNGDRLIVDDNYPTWGEATQAHMTHLLEAYKRNIDESQAAIREMRMRSAWYESEIVKVSQAFGIEVPGLTDGGDE